MAGRAVVGPGGVRRLHLGARAGPVPRGPGHGSGPAAQSPGLVGGHRCLDGERAGAAGLRQAVGMVGAGRAADCLAPPVGRTTTHRTRQRCPQTLAHQFVVAVTVVSFLSWAVLGSSTAYFYRRFSNA